MAAPSHAAEPDREAALKQRLRVLEARLEYLEEKLTNSNAPPLRARLKKPDRPDESWKFRRRDRAGGNEKDRGR